MNKMTKAELIEALKDFPDDMEVGLSTKDSDNGWYEVEIRRFMGRIFIDRGGYMIWGDDD
jgi:hypothetical protein